MPLPRFARFLVAAFLLAVAAGAYGAETSSPRVALAGNVSPRLPAATDIAEIDGAHPLPSLTLWFSLSASQQARLTQLLDDQQNPASPRFHQWLTPEQFRQCFGPSADQLQAATGWLAAQGFSVTAVARSGLFVRFSGTAAQAEQAFSTHIHTVRLHGETHFANLTAPSLPGNLAAFTAGISGLDDFRVQPHAQVRELSGDAPQPQLTTASGTHYLAPADFYTIYGETNLLSGSVTGTGVTIAVVGQTDINASDLTAFQTAAGLTLKQPQVSTYGTDPGYPSAADLNETEMDLEWANAVAPGAAIFYVNSTDVFAGSLTEAIDNNVAPIVATSYGECEAEVGVSALSYYSVLFQMASAEGITLTAASGDSGATDCDANVGSAVNGLAVDFPASSPLVTGLGGTELSEGVGSYWNTGNTASGGSAKSYIPEVVWNDDNAAAFAATGGGASDYFSKPAWQTGTGVPNDFARDVPDVSLAASINHDGYLICTAGNCTNGFQNASGGYQVSGGTSVAAPAFAGLLALVEQKTGARLGNANPVLYALANSSFAANVFHDVTSGTNASACTTGTLNCASGGPIGFAATAGYDQATGWGSVNAYNMVQSWSSVTPTTTATGAYPSVTNLAGSATTAVTGTPVIFTVTVASATTTSSATPTGSIQMTVDSVAVGSAIALSAGTASYTLDTTSLSVGTHIVQATYLGDGTFAGSRAAFQLVVTAAGGPDFALTPPSANVTVKGGDIATAVQFTVTSLGNFSGNVAFTASLQAPLAAQSSFTLFSVAVAPSSPGTTAFTLLAYTNNGTSRLHPATGGWYRAGSGVALATLLLVIAPRRRKFAWLAVLFAAVGLFGLSGCAGPAAPTSSPTITTTPTPAGNYTVLIQATATINGAVTEHTSTIAYVVQ